MSVYKTSKKVRYTVSVIYILVMTFVVGGSYLYQQERAASERQSVMEQPD